MTKNNQQLDIIESTLYIVPTPIGNLEDITQRALYILKNVDFIAAEDTRHTGLLLQHFSIRARLLSLHIYNEQQKTKILLTKLKEGKTIALVSDSGTPLINDPGYNLVRLCREAGIRVTPLPGACAAITALSAAGLPANRFCYEGFLPVKRKARLDRLKALAQESRTMVFYDSTHRLCESLEDMVATWGPMRHVIIVRELTKIWESFYGANVGELLDWVSKKDICIYGEIVLIAKGYQHTSKDLITSKVLNTLSLLLTEFPVKKAAALTAKIHNVKKNKLYHCALLLNNKIQS